MAVLKGGRGHKAPYDTTHVRVPVPLKPKVDILVEEYKNYVLEGKVSETEKWGVSAAMTLTSLDEALGIARSILKQKKSAKESLTKLLTALYGGEIKL